VCGEIHLLQLSTMTASPQPSFFCVHEVRRILLASCF
jgi:hypothetical protein